MNKEVTLSLSSDELSDYDLLQALLNHVDSIHADCKGKTSIMMHFSRGNQMKTPVFMGEFESKQDSDCSMMFRICVTAISFDSDGATRAETEWSSWSNRFGIAYLEAFGREFFGVVDKSFLPLPTNEVFMVETLPRAIQ